MTEQVLAPNLSLLSEEYVLIQAWKKTASYIRSHNWYSDTLALDKTAADLPAFLAHLSERVRQSPLLSTTPVRIVPAPKSQAWGVDPATKKWQPTHRDSAGKKLRPLAHVAIEDQVLATAYMLCLANRVETEQGDPQNSLYDDSSRKAVISYGNRLFCSPGRDGLEHRWGSTKLYRSYFTDYRNFLARPEIVSERWTTNHSVIIQSDLRQFYDRVSPNLFEGAVRSFQREGDDPGFFDALVSMMSWTWHVNDQAYVDAYARDNGLDDFSRIVLPQGLAASGFFANLVLTAFDQAMRESFETEVAEGVFLRDACRYVDDIRLVLSLNHKPDLKALETQLAGWMQSVLDRLAQGLVVSEDKTRAALSRGDERPLARQSARMERIQHAISGGFDALRGEEILGFIEGLLRAQTRYSSKRLEEQGWLLAPVPDVRDETVARFAAARFRSTFRSLRPLLEPSSLFEVAGKRNELRDRIAGIRSRVELDDEARTFALGLIEDWVSDPSNVRVLRIGLDLWPDADVITRVIELLRQYTAAGGGRKGPRRVAWYCLSEVFRAAATETGFVDDQERLPEGLDLDRYRAVLADEAARIMQLPRGSVPWYLRQQVMLFLAAFRPGAAGVTRSGNSEETKDYRQLILLLQGDGQSLPERERATFGILARRAFLDRDRAVELVAPIASQRVVQLIAEKDPSFALELVAKRPDLGPGLTARVRHDLALSTGGSREGWLSLVDLVFQKPHVLRNEPALLKFAEMWLAKVAEMPGLDAVAPGDVLVRLKAQEVDELEILGSRVSADDSLYRPPNWCEPDERWRFQLGYLLRFVLTASPDFTRGRGKSSWREHRPIYRNPAGHWQRRKYGLFSGHAEFGDDCLPITDWTEKLLLALLAWPGAQRPGRFQRSSTDPEAARRLVRRRRHTLARLRGSASSLCVLPMPIPWAPGNVEARPLRIAVVQTVIPSSDEFRAEDIALSSPEMRRRHRRHLSAALAALERLLQLRETHKGLQGRLDLVVLPELAVHPKDVATHLIPFVRRHRTVVVTGLTYHQNEQAGHFVNSALWLVPTWSGQGGFQIVRREQGKHHLARQEEQMNEPNVRIVGHRPCQWIFNYPWQPKGGRPLRLTAAICYDATDICLAADLRSRSDVFIVPALNRDIDTFDHMALALHYHMYQLVVVANNGSFGGSNAYAPYKQSYVRQVFHLHGQPQATIAFLEIERIDEFLRRGHGDGDGVTAPGSPAAQWKHPPAGWNL